MIGGGLAGLAAAARLAKARHQVILLEASDRLGGAWARQELDGIAVDAAPPIFSFPAPWRDLFRKSGRALEAEFTRSGAELVDAPPARHVFDDGPDFVLPTGRGDQESAITDRYGRDAAERWRDLLDRLGDVWQTLRPLGVESELADRRQLTRTVRNSLLHKRTLADLARALDQPQLAAIVADLAYSIGSEPSRTPAFCAVQLYLDRTFGRWTAGSGTTMINTLADRLAVRKVDVRTGTRVTAISADARSVAVAGTDVAGTSVDAGSAQTIEADAVVATCNPDQLYNDLLPTDVVRRERRRYRRLRPAIAPTVTLDWIGEPEPSQLGGPTETVHHHSSGGPRIVYTRPAADRVLRITHDYGRPVADPSAGVGWRGFRSWLNRPPISSELPTLFTAGPSSAAGPTPSMQVLSAALAAYACQRLIAPDRPLEPR